MQTFLSPGLFFFNPSPQTVSTGCERWVRWAGVMERERGRGRTLKREDRWTDRWKGWVFAKESSEGRLNCHLSPAKPKRMAQLQHVKVFQLWHELMPLCKLQFAAQNVTVWNVMMTPYAWVREKQVVAFLQHSKQEISLSWLNARALEMKCREFARKWDAAKCPAVLWRVKGRHWRSERSMRGCSLSSHLQPTNCPAEPFRKNRSARWPHPLITAARPDLLSPAQPGPISKLTILPKISERRCKNLITAFYYSK